MNGRGAAVARAFARAEGYHRAARVQRTAARDLAALLDGAGLPERPRVLELGCGSGLLSRRLLEHRPRGTFLFTDIAPAMLDRCRHTLSGMGGDVRFGQLDGEDVSREWAAGESWDLIAAGMVFQWLDDPLSAPGRLVPLLRPGGLLLFSTLLPHTFREWRQVLAARHLPSGVADFADLATWRRRLPGNVDATLTEREIIVDHPSVLDFLRELKQIGAYSPKAGHQPLGAGILRRLLRDLDASGKFAITHHILYGVLRKIS